ncbi:MAG: hypothetical protein ACLFWB_09705 [Armatimonadota bacterium]
MTMIPYDGHIHTDTGRGRDSLLELIRAAEAAELELVVLADSYESVSDDARDRARVIVEANAKSSVRIVPGLEVAIRNESGFVDLPDGHARLFPVVFAALGGRTEGIALDPPADKNRYISHLFRALFGVVEKKTITAIARPFNIGQFPAPLSPSQLPVSGLQDLATAMAEHETAFEISNQIHWWFPELDVAEFTAEYADLMAIFGDRNVKFIISSDATCAGGVGNTIYARRLMKEAGVEKSQVINLPKMIARRNEKDE